MKNTCVILFGKQTMISIQRSFVVLFENVTVSSDPDWATVDAKIEESDRNSVLNLHINILKMITKPTVSMDPMTSRKINIRMSLFNLLLQIRGYLRFDSMNEDETEDDQSNFIEIVNKTANMCQLMNLKTFLPVVHLSFGDLNKFGTMFTSCPIRKVNDVFYILIAFISFIYILIFIHFSNTISYRILKLTKNECHRIYPKRISLLRFRFSVVSKIKPKTI